MFNFENFSKSKMKWTTITAYVVYFLITILAPVLTICIEYGLFTGKGTSERVAISGWAAVLLIIVAVVGMTLLKKAIEKIPDVKLSMARFKYTLKTISGCVVPAAAFYCIHLFQKDVDLACNTGYWLAGWFLLAALFDGIVITSVDRENKYRTAAAEAQEIEKRKDKI